jgi:hypothetical protein
MYVDIIDGQVRLVCMQMDNFNLFLYQPMGNQQTFVSVSPIFLKFCKQKAELKKNGKVGFVCCIQKTEMANFCLFAANGNEKWKFVFLGRQTINIINDCCFSKCAHLRYIYFF